ncbi:hypothetical protein C8R46DRAFT_1225766 [Mycena filopes]|nr:hypothetical protein C8R46DRAFT_1225766 [Mycena filopes]
MAVPPLPPELEQDIFEIAVRSSPRDSRVKLNLSLVARHVQSWVDREFYKSLEVSGASADKFLRLVELKPAGFFATTVKTLVLTNFPVYLTEAQAIGILSICTGVQYLAFWCLEFPGRNPAVAQLPLRRLFMPLSHIQRNVEGSAATPPCLSTVTHLNMSFLHPVDVSDLEVLGRLPRLTHVALHVSAVLPPHTMVVIASCAALQALVIILEPTDVIREEVVAVYSFDPRIVLLQHPSVTLDREVSRFGLDEVWTLAEHAIAMRMSR